MLHSGTMSLLGSILDQVHLTTIVDIGITALLIYWLFSLIRGTRAVRLVIGVSVLVLVYGLAVAFDLRLLTQILQGGAVVGLFALVVIFQPELRRALERIGRVGSLGWLLSPAESRAVVHVSTEVARAAAELSADGHGALIVLERETGPRGGRRDRGDDPRRCVGRPAVHDLHAAVGAPRRRRHHPRRPDRRRRRAPAAGRDLDPHGAVRHAPPGRPRHHRADRRGRHRRVRGERPDQPRRTRTGSSATSPRRVSAGRSRPCSTRPGGRRGAFGWRAASRGGSVDGRSPRLRELGRLVGRPAAPRDARSATAVAPPPAAQRP